MFDRIAPGYDRANTLLSLGTDRRWRRRAVAAASPPPGGAALDVACGTGRLAFALRDRVGARGRVVGLDFSEGMLAVARTARPDVEWVQGDAAGLPFGDGVFDVAATAFGLRNFALPAACLAEMARVVHPDGRLVVLEFLRPPPGPVGRAYGLYLRHALPRIGGWVAGDRAAYRYLDATVESFLTGDQLVELAQRSGWRDVQLRRLNAGTVGLVVGRA